MSAQKHSSSTYGQWLSGTAGHPVFELGAAVFDSPHPLLLHRLSTQGLTILADQFGRLQILADSPETTVPLNGDSQAVLSTFHLRCRGSRNDGVIGLLTAGAPTLTDRKVEWSAGSIRYTWRMHLEGQPCAFEMEVIAPSQAPFITVTACILNEGNSALQFTAEAIGCLGLQPADTQAETDPTTFCRDGVAILAEAVPGFGDFFLAGEAGSTAEAGTGMAMLSQPVKLAAGETWRTHFLVGCRHDCTSAWLRGQWQQIEPETIKRAWIEALPTVSKRIPELWMREEIMWADSRLLACRRPPLAAAYDDAFLIEPAITRCGDRTSPADVRQRLMICIAIADSMPAVSEAHLFAAAAAQLSTGRVGNVAAADSSSAMFDPERDATDLEILFLLACLACVKARGSMEILDQPAPFLDDGQANLWEHLLRAEMFVTHEIGCGPRGLIRWGRHDLNGWIDQPGRRGRGESVLNTAMLIYCLDQLGQLALARDPQDPLAARLEADRRRLLAACEATFDKQWFVRGYTDDGRPLGNLNEGRLFLDVQAWAVLAKCGSMQQRQQALRSALSACAADPGPRCLSAPYPVPPPTDVATVHVLPGHGLNGGVCPSATAWFVWALASEGMMEQALSAWQNLAFRQILECVPCPPSGITDRWGCVASGLAGPAAGFPSLPESSSNTWLPTADLFLWQHFAMSRILEAG